MSNGDLKRTRPRQRAVGNGPTWLVPFGLLVALLALFPLASAASATALPSTITENMTLTAASNPYTGGGVTIASGVTVKAEPGVNVKVNSLYVEGTLLAEGTAESPVRFVGKEEETV